MYDDDAQLASAAASGDREAFGELVERYQRKALGVAMRLLGNVDNAMEVSQEAFLRAYQALGQLKEPSRFGPWLMRIVSNQALNYRRSHRRDPRVYLGGPSERDDDADRGPGTLQLEADEPQPYEHAVGAETADLLRQAIDELPEHLRTPLLLFAVEKMPQKQIAEAMGASLQTVKWSVFEARRRLKKRLEKNL